MGDDDLGWAKKMVDEGAWIFHLPTKTIGRVAKLFDGSGEQYVSSITREATLGPVIEMQGGASFVALPGAFMRLEEAEASFYVAAVEMLSDACRGLGAAAAEHGVRPMTCAVLLGAALRAQAAELERALPRPPQDVAT